jgi:hypothetical protein
MIHLAAFVLCVAGFTALAFGVRRQQRDKLGGSLPPAVTYGLRAVGAGALLAALGTLIAGFGWSLGLVMFSGHTSIAAGIVYCGLIGYLRSSLRRMRHP